MTVKQMVSDLLLISEATPFRPFTALCNLSQYKSCSVRTVSVNDAASFAIKLVPCGFIGNKQLLIATTDENEITAWMAVCKSSIGKKSRLPSFHNTNSGTLPHTSNFAISKSHHLNRTAEFDENLLDNEVYEPYSSDDKIPAILEEAGDFVKLNMTSPECHLRLVEERIEILDCITGNAIHWFPYLFIRRFGAAQGVLRIDAGRRCSPGDGRFFFRCSPPNGQPVDALVTQIRQLALEAKQRSKAKQSQLSMNSCATDLPGRQASTVTIDRDAVDIRDTDLGSSPSPDHRSRGKTRHKSQDQQRNGIDSAGKPKLAPRAVHDRSESREGVQEPSSSSNRDLFRAKPARATSESRNLHDPPNLYDNLDPNGRQVIRLPGAVNVLPLPVRSKGKDGSQSRLNLRDSQSTNETPIGSEKSFPVNSQSTPSPKGTNRLSSSQSSTSPNCSTGDSQATSPTLSIASSVQSTNTRLQPDVRKSQLTSPTSHQPTTPTSPPTAPKPNAFEISEARLRNGKSGDGHPTTLAKLLQNNSNTNTNGAKGSNDPAPSRITLQPPAQTIQASGASIKTGCYRQSQFDSSIDESKSLINDLDSVIDELYRESQAAARFTREAAEKRKQMTQHYFFPKSNQMSSSQNGRLGNGIEQNGQKSAENGK